MVNVSGTLCHWEHGIFLSILICHICMQKLPYVKIQQGFANFHVILLHFTIACLSLVYYLNIIISITILWLFSFNFIQYKLELRFYGGWKPARGLQENCDSENPNQYFLLKIGLNPLSDNLTEWSNTLKQFVSVVLALKGLTSFINQTY